MADIPKAIWEGSFKIFGIDIKCATLEDGRRIILAESMDALFEVMATGDTTSNTADFAAFYAWKDGGKNPE